MLYNVIIKTKFPEFKPFSKDTPKAIIKNLIKAVELEITEKGEKKAFRKFFRKNINISATKYFTFHKEKYGKTFIINKKHGDK